MRVQRALVTTERGAKRKVQQDVVLEMSDVPLYAVADGVNGAEAGRVAIEVLRARADVIAEHGKKVASDHSTGTRLAIGQYFETVFDECGKAIRAHSEKVGKANMASSMVAATVLDRFAYVAHVGDTRAYLFRDGDLRCLTNDHTLAMHQLRMGEITVSTYLTSPFRHTLTQALGVNPKLDVDIAEVRLVPGDVLILSSNGLGRVVTEENLGEILSDNPLGEAIQRIAKLATDARAPDDVTVVALEVDSEEPTQPHVNFAAAYRHGILFTGLEEPQWLVLASYLEEVSFEPGAVIMREGEPHESFYTLASGEIELYRGDRLVGTVGPGEHFGLINLALDTPATVTAKAKTRVDALALSRTLFRQAIQSKPILAWQLSEVVLAALGDELVEANSRLIAAEKAVRGIFGG